MSKHTHCKTAQSVNCAASECFKFVHDLPPSGRRAWRRTLSFSGTVLGTCALLGVISEAQAAGGSYVVDDGGINAAGECNIDTWYSSIRHQSANHHSELSLDCTPQALPSLQLGAAVARTLDDGDAESEISPKAKLQLYSNEALGLEAALSAEANFVLNRRHSFDGAEVSIPVTFQPFEPLRLNFSAGWSYAYDAGNSDDDEDDDGVRNGDRANRLIWGVGFEYDVFESLTLIAERFGKQGDEQGWQAGPRLHIGKRLDIDFVVGRHLTEDRDQWFTAGATLRF
ncbi:MULTISPECIES: hypothetical protein [unclassified Pseudomonas]|uniref:hypothetical protein n=1 Tax=unclassified Pseudomonas TaxID=196821 RepID=UPI002AC98292|nr:MULTISPECIES: hypothetical protein [unclassified Pseudomonas]MEB0045983.1 hypothetical protein [Pseudomonas sp. Dout3]MEB0097243.1 hypothetical protein [Pseudomonas sp. DC1.2]WPX56819.1 hypothetical protein RHM68_14230 [Pseudomonas sp. DC1.2]